jgi:hypothetical protein
MTKAQRRHRRDQLGALIEAGRKPDRVRETQPGAGDSQNRIIVSLQRPQQRHGRRPGSGAQQPADQVMRALGIEAEKERSEQAIKHRTHSW